jgi:pilus assembly protein CpaF
MCTLPLLGREHWFVVPTVAGCIDIVVHIATEHDGSRRVHEIVGIPVESSATSSSWSRSSSAGGQLVGVDGYPPHLDRFQRAGIDVAHLLGRPAANEREGAARRALCSG